jgi:branched-chain amino acid transport system substrate-binding protein
MKRALKKVTAVCLSFVVILISSVAIPGTGMAADTVKIGFINPLSGDQEATGRSFIAGTQFAVDEQNAKGGLLGKKIEVIFTDSEYKPDVALQRAKKLILEDKVNFLFGTQGSGIAIALNKVATNNKTLFIHHVAFADEITGKEFSRYAFRMNFPTYSMWQTMVQLMVSQPYKKYYVLQPDFAAGHSGDATLKKMVKDELPDVSFVGTDFSPIGTKDYGPYISKIAAAKPDALIVPLWGSDLIRMIKQGRAMGLKSLPIFALIASDPYIMKELGEDGTGLHVVNQYSLRIQTPENQDMIRRYHDKHKDDKDILTVWPYYYVTQAMFALQMTFAAIEKAGSLDTEKIIETFENDFSWKSPVGLWKMRKCDHQVMMPTFGMQMTGGKNPFYDFPWEGEKVLTFPTEKVTIPATKDYNERCQ